MYGKGAVYKGNVRKLCWLFKEGMSIHDCALLPVYAHYSNRSNGKFSSIFHTVPTLINEDHLFLDLMKLFASQSLRSDHETKYVVHDSMKGLAASFFNKGIHKVVPQCDRYRNLHCDDLEK